MRVNRKSCWQLRCVVLNVCSARYITYNRVQTFERISEMTEASNYHNSSLVLTIRICACTAINMLIVLM